MTSPQLFFAEVGGLSCVFIAAHRLAVVSWGFSPLHCEAFSL